MEVTLISTRHDNLGKCNSSALCQILEQIRPEVIFEEKPPSCFDEYYLEKNRTSLETQAIISYIASHDVQHIPVDSENLPSESFFREHENLYKRIEGLVDIPTKVRQRSALKYPIYSGAKYASQTGHYHY